MIFFCLASRFFLSLWCSRRVGKRRCAIFVDLGSSKSYNAVRSTSRKISLSLQLTRGVRHTNRPKEQIIMATMNKVQLLLLLLSLSHLNSCIISCWGLIPLIDGGKAMPSEFTVWHKPSQLLLHVQTFLIHNNDDNNSDNILMY